MTHVARTITGAADLARSTIWLLFLAALVLSSGAARAEEQVSPPGFAVIAPEPRVIDLGKWPEGMVLVGDAVWIAESGSRRIVKVNLATGAVETTVKVGRLPVNLAASGDGTVYAAVVTDKTIFRQPAKGKGKVLAKLTDGFLAGLAMGKDGLFAVTSTEDEQRTTTLNRIDPASGAIKRSSALVGEARALAVHRGFAWVLQQDGLLSRFDPDTLYQSDATTLPGFLWSLAGSGSRIVVGGREQQMAGLSVVVALDPGAPKSPALRLLESQELIVALAATETRVAALGLEGTVWILNAADLAPLKRFSTGRRPQSALFAGGRLYIATHQGEGENGALLVYDGLVD